MFKSADARSVPLMVVLNALGMQVKEDALFEPRKNQRTSRLHITDSESNYVYELVVTGQQWFDARKSKGGGGAVDLVMHLRACTFSQAMLILAPLVETGEKKPR